DWMARPIEAGRSSMDPRLAQDLTRRQFFGRTATRLGNVALLSLLNPRLFAHGARAVRDGARPDGSPDLGTLRGTPHFAPKAKRVIWLFMSGAPSQID